AQAWQFAARGLNPVVRLVCLCRAYGRTEPVTLVEGAIVEPTDPVLVLPPVDTDAPAELEVDIDDLTRGGTGANRWRLASMPLGPDGEVPALSMDFTDPETPAPEMETLAGNMPPATVVRQDWQTLATGEMTWPDDPPPPQHVELFARVADMEPVGAPIERISATAVEGPLHTVVGESNGNT